MGRYDDLLYQLIKNNMRNCFKRPPDKELEAQIKRYPGIPCDYMDFLKEIGYGDIGDGYLIIYSSLISPSDVYDSVKANKLRDIVFLGDDFSGNCIGFENFGVRELVEVDENQKVSFLNISFENFIKNKIAEYFNCFNEYRSG